MLNLDRNNLPLLSEELLKKQRTTLLIIAFLLLAGGILCLVNPFASGAALSIVVGVLLLLSGAGLIIAMIANRAQNTWPMIGGILLGVAYLIIVMCSSPARWRAFWRWRSTLPCCSRSAASRAWRPAICAADCRATGCSSSLAYSI